MFAAKCAMSSRMGVQPYRCEAVSLAGFIQQLAVSYIANGYFHYVVGWLPERKDPKRVDTSIIDRYGIAVSKFVRARRKAVGKANLQYLRYGRLFVLLATDGDLPALFDNERRSVRDVRRVPLKAFGYSICVRRGRVDVGIDREEFKRLRAYFVERAVHRGGEVLAAELAELPFEPYRRVRHQLQKVVRAVNQRRRAAGYLPLPPTAVRVTRRLVRPFGNVRSDEANGEHEGDGR